MKTAELSLGDKVREDITGFTGVVTGIVHYISGCDQALLQPPVKEDGSYVTAHWLDIDRLSIVEAKSARKSRGRRGAEQAAPIR